MTSTTILISPKTMASSEASPEIWLESQLLGLQSSLPFLDENMVGGLVGYCPMASHNDIYDYLSNIIGDKVISNPIAAGYINLRKLKSNSQNLPQTNLLVSDSSEFQKDLEDKNFRVYMKSTAETDSQSQIKRKSRLKKKSEREFDSFGTSADQFKTEKNRSQMQSQNLKFAGSSQPTFSEPGEPESKPEGSQKNPNLKTVNFTELVQKRSDLFSKKITCNCQANKHRLINNCLTCGKIICEQEGEGPCSFCGTLVLKDGSEYFDLDGSDFANDFSQKNLGKKISSSLKEEISAAEFRAIEFKNKLINFDRNSAQRTVVYDDQSDYFQMESSTWLSEEEKKQLQDKESERKRLEEEKRKNLVVSFDLIGRKVLMDNDSHSSQNVELFFPAENKFSDNKNYSEGEKKSGQIKLNPSSNSPAPIFVPPRSENPVAKNQIKSQDKSQNRKSKVTNLEPKIWQRVQHDDPFSKFNAEVSI